MRAGDLVRCILTIPIDVAIYDSDRTHKLQPGILGLVVGITYGSNYALIMVGNEVIDVDKDFWQVF